jgi:predicted metal-dependent phosphoesterase TrpH
LIDLHLHTSASDGLLAPRDLVARAAAAGITVMAITDHDTVAGYADARTAADTCGIELVPGIEITAVEQSRDIHVLGYFFDPSSPTLAEFLETQRNDRVRRIRAMSARLAALGCPVDVEPLVAAAAARPGRSVGRPQLADALVQAGFAQDRTDAFDRLLGNHGPAYEPRQGASPEEVIALLAKAGGIASLAHPGVINNDAIIPRLASNGLAALEVRHSDHLPATEATYRAMAKSLGLAMSGGSDFHGDTGYRADSLGVVTLPAADFERLKMRIPR